MDTLVASVPPEIVSSTSGISSTMTTLINTHTNQEYDVVVYVPCHYDFSQIEFVAPFLERFGGKVFVYKWHGMKDKMMKQYQDNYSTDVTVHEFSIANIVRHILKEKKKVVLLMTASLGYAFGRYQKQLFNTIKKILPDKVAAVSVIGHCMYGCASCTGADHKVPVYFSRYYNNRLPYTADTIRKEYLQSTSSSTSARTVLVAPSTGETSLIVQREIIEYLLQLQREGKYQFIWKFHPAAFNPGDFDVNYEYHKKELDNYAFVRANFAVTQEMQPCLLPFLEAFDVVLCDLHSTVPFTASYFAPKVIITYHNDGDYGTPERDPAFLKNLQIFDNLEELKQILRELPAAKGDKNFFTSQYGLVDGNEALRFAQLAQWPTSTATSTTSTASTTSATSTASTISATTSTSSSAAATSSPTIDNNEYRMVLSAVCSEVKEMLATAERENSEELGDCKQSIGLDYDYNFMRRKSSIDKDTTATVPIATSLPSQHSQTIRVMSFNLWHGGEMLGLELEKTADAIRMANADVVGLQETAGKPDTSNNRTDNTRKLASLLGWHYFEQGIIMNGRGNLHPFSIISRWPIVKHTPKKWGVKLKTDTGIEFYVFNTHLAYCPYQPYQLLSIPYEEFPFLHSEEEAVQSCLNSRKPQLDAMMKEIREVLNERTPVFVTGDFNEPGYQDWTDETALLGIHPLRVKWPSSNMIAELGFTDVFRLFKQDVILYPGFTFSTRTKEDDPTDHHDRIDFVFVGGSNVEPQSVDLVGEDAHVANIVVTPWPSDHRAVVGTFTITTPQF